MASDENETALTEADLAAEQRLVVRNSMLACCFCVAVLLAGRLLPP